MLLLTDKPDQALAAPVDERDLEAILGGLDPKDAELLRELGQLRPDIAPTMHDRFDAREKELAALPQIDLPLEHRFTPHLYTRTIFMPAGAIVTSKIHKFEHPFVVSAGRLVVFSEGTGPVELRAPYVGTTQPGTRRVLVILEDTVWSTFHVTDLTDPDAIVEAVTVKHEEHLGDFQQRWKAANAPALELQHGKPLNLIERTQL